MVSNNFCPENQTQFPGLGVLKATIKYNRICFIIHLNDLEIFPRNKILHDEDSLVTHRVSLAENSLLFI